MWIYILAELLVFALFNEFQQYIDRRSAFVNPLALLTSSYIVVHAVAAISKNNSRACMRWPVTLWLLIPGGLISLAFSLAN